MVYTIGDMVKTTGLSQYGNVNDIIVPMDTIGRIVKIRKRYTGTPNEYIQYQLEFTEYHPVDSNGLDNLYHELHLNYPN
jgi:hypothetical protein